MEFKGGLDEYEERIKRTLEFMGDLARSEIIRKLNEFYPIEFRFSLDYQKYDVTVVITLGQKFSYTTEKLVKDIEQELKVSLEVDEVLMADTTGQLHLYLFIKKNQEKKGEIKSE